MIKATAEGWARLTLLSCLAAAQLTLLVRADYAAFAIMASLSWLAGALLLMEREEQTSAPALDQLPRSRVLPGLLLLLWSLLVLSRVARLYDPLLHLLPLASLLGLALLGGLAWRSSGLAALALIGALLPAQVLINRFLPTAPWPRSPPGPPPCCSGCWVARPSPKGETSCCQGRFWWWMPVAPA